MKEAEGGGDLWEAVPRGPECCSQDPGPGFCFRQHGEGTACTAPAWTPGLAMSLLTQGPRVVNNLFRDSASLLENGDHDNSHQGHQGTTGLCGHSTGLAA